MTLTCTIKVVPKSGKQKAVLDKTGRLKIYLKSPPEDGKANKELVSYLSRVLKIPQRDIVIFVGEHGRTKMLKIHKEITFEQLLGFLDIVQQTKLF